MQKSIKKIIVSSGIVLLTLNIVHAEWYVGADTIQQEVIPYPSSLSESELSTNGILQYKENKNYSNSSISLFGGYQTTDNFSLQLEYQDDLSFGIDDMFAGSSLWFPEVRTQDFESSGLFLSGISRFPINDSGILYMKGGLFNWEVDSNYYQSSK
ncbi:MAG: hypothetical protein P8X88_09035, partial [Gammaproteobacteria bacterium]